MDVPRDRAGTFEPVLVPKDERRLGGCSGQQPWSGGVARGVGLTVPECGALEAGALAPYRAAFVDAMRASQLADLKPAIDHVTAGRKR